MVCEHVGKVRSLWGLLCIGDGDDGCFMDPNSRGIDSVVIPTDAWMPSALKNRVKSTI